MRIMLGLVALALTAPVQAEVFEMNGHFPAAFREVSLTRSIGIDRIAGRDGMALGLAIEAELSQRGPDGRPYYDLIALSRRGPEADALVSGMADASVRESDVKRKVEQCAEKQGDKCVRKEKVEATCLQEMISFSSTLRVAGSDDGRILYTQTRPQTDSITTCPGDKGKPSPKDRIAKMVRTAADRFIDDIMPRHENYHIRLREGREGMDKVMGQAFKDSIRLSQRDPVAACTTWAEMERALPGHPSLLFNLGLCAERMGDYAAAERAYGRAGAAQEDVTRVRDLTIGRDDAKRRATGG
ncbi:tetratricopeptide repeat protein [Sphingobium sp. WCS2017Hpa-17]|uniref:tetratricopeptide repeat protein n=1 Tax=Sphingobium sp. WCS2017Hpa-17 TaxID=3073638 RepID=UPI00288936D4|nr:tetratricopeptide repeat protein [Sphingobium sp. WCS2017Hpa-17]